MVRWHLQFNGHEFEQTPGDSEGQGSLACCQSWSHRVRHDLVTKQKQTFKLATENDLGLAWECK